MSGDFEREWKKYGDDLRAELGGSEDAIPELLRARAVAHVRTAIGATALAGRLIRLADVEHMPKGRIAAKHIRYVLDDLRKLSGELSKKGADI